MIFIHGSLAMGGVETFIVRMAKQRSLEGKKTIIILLSTEDKSDEGLVAEARKYATLLFLSDVVFLPSFISRIYPFHLVLLLKIKNDISTLFTGIEHVHATSGICIQFYFKLLNFLPAKHTFTVGVYHSTEFTWGGRNLPFFEKINRDSFYNKISRANIIFFNESMLPLHEKYSGNSFDGVNLFPLGVVDDDFPLIQSPSLDKGKVLKLVSVGRLVNFKTYNIHMLHVVSELKRSGLPVVYDIYGTGPLEDEMKKLISDLQLSAIINLKGVLDYNSFPEVISQYDIFIGSGTAIIQAANLGVVSIVGVECVEKPETYGFFADIQGFSYNEDGLYEKKPIIDFMLEYTALSLSAKEELRMRHIAKAKQFTMDTCVKNFESITSPVIAQNIIERGSSSLRNLVYSLSFLSTSIAAKLNKTSLSEKIRDSDAH